MSMSNDESYRLAPLRDTLLTILNRTNNKWLCLPADVAWSLSSPCAILESEEVSPGHEDDEAAGVPAFAKQHGLMQVLPVSVVQDIVSNTLAQRPSASP